MMWRYLARSLSSAIAWILHDDRGISGTVVTIALPGLIGFGALGVETGLWYTIKFRNQSAADAAAISAAYEVLAGKTDVTGDLTPAASEAATQNGYTGTTPAAVIYPYSDSLVSNGVAVALEQTQGTFLASMFLSGVKIATKSVAVIEVLENPCILALGTSGRDVEISDLSGIDMPECSAAANSVGNTAIDLHGSTSSITAATLVTPGEISLQGNPIDPAAPPSEFTLTSRPMIGAPSISDPYARTLTHAFLTSNIPATRVTRNFWNETTTITPAHYERGMSFGARAVIDLTPGAYYVTNGNFSVAPGATVSGASGVTIILTTTDATGGAIGNLQISPGATVTLQAPNSGTFSGLVIVQDSNGLPPGTTYTSRRSTFEGPGATLNGLVYFPNASMTFQGNPSSAGPKCLVVVVDALIVDGPSSLATSGCTSAGLTNLPTINTVSLAE
jgi:hypothetical protein